MNEVMNEVMNRIHTDSENRYMQYCQPAELTSHLASQILGSRRTAVTTRYISLAQPFITDLNFRVQMYPADQAGVLHVVTFRICLENGMILEPAALRALRSIDPSSFPNSPDLGWYEDRGDHPRRNLTNISKDPSTSTSPDLQQKGGSYSCCCGRCARCPIQGRFETTPCKHWTADGKWWWRSPPGNPKVPPLHGKRRGATIGKRHCILHPQRILPQQGPHYLAC